jgi:hypothetical protein
MIDSKFSSRPAWNSLSHADQVSVTDLKKGNPYIRRERSRCGRLGAEDMKLRAGGASPRKKLKIQ